MNPIIPPTHPLTDPYFDRTAGKIWYQGRWWKAQYDGKDVLDTREQEKIFKRLQYEHQNTQLAASSPDSKKIVFTNEKVLVYPKTSSTNCQEVLTTSGRNTHDIIQQRQIMSASFQKIKDLIQTKKLDQKKETTWHPEIAPFFPTTGTPPSTFEDWDKVYKKLEEEIEILKKQKHDPLQKTLEIEKRLHLHRIYKAYVAFEREKLRPTAATALRTISLVPSPPLAPQTALPQTPQVSKSPAQKPSPTSSSHFPTITLVPLPPPQATPIPSQSPPLPALASPQIPPQRSAPVPRHYVQPTGHPRGILTIQEEELSETPTSLGTKTRGKQAKYTTTTTPRRTSSSSSAPSPQPTPPPAHARTASSPTPPPSAGTTGTGRDVIDLHDIELDMIKEESQGDLPLQKTSPPQEQQPPSSTDTAKTEKKPIDLSSIHLDVTASESERRLETSTPPPSAGTTEKEGAPVELGDISVVMIGSEEDRSPKTLPTEKFIQQICEDFFPEDKKLTKPERAARLRILAILHQPNSDILNCYKEIDKELLIETLRTDALALNSAPLKIAFGLVSTSPKKVTKEVEKFFKEKIRTLKSLAKKIEAAPKNIERTDSQSFSS